MKRRLFTIMGMAGVLALALMVLAGCPTNTPDNYPDTQGTDSDTGTGTGTGTPNAQPYIYVTHTNTDTTSPIRIIRIWNATKSVYEVTDYVTMGRGGSKNYSVIAGNSYWVQIYMNDSITSQPMYMSSTFSVSAGKYRGVLFAAGNNVRFTGEFTIY